MKFDKKRSWFKVKGYTHLTKRISKDKKEFVISYVSNVFAIERHAFYPLIHRLIIQRRYKKSDLDNGKYLRSHIELKKDGSKKSTAKIRHIFYATHLDAHIYAYYSNIVLGKLYEQYLRRYPKLGESICAYRKIKKDNSEGNKSSVHFAKDLFDYIKTKENCVTLTFDIENFFDSLNHEYLKTAWKNLIGRKLPKDHYNIYKSLVQYSYVELKDLVKEFGHGHFNNLRRNSVVHFCETPSDFRERVRKKKYIKLNKKTDESGRLKGIPQGTPISAFLSNLYLLEFDKIIYEEVVKKYNAFYRRYSDDIAIVCELKYYEKVKDVVVNRITEFHLSIHKDKTKAHLFLTENTRLVVYEFIKEINFKLNSPLQYLGFDFYGDRTLIRSSSLAKFYRSLKLSVRVRTRKSFQQKINDPDWGVVFLSKLYRRFSHLGARQFRDRKRNYLSYVYYASKEMQEPAIRKQIRNAWQLLVNEIHANKNEQNESLDKTLNKLRSLGLIWLANKISRKVIYRLLNFYRMPDKDNTRNCLSAFQAFLTKELQAKYSSKIPELAKAENLYKITYLMNNSDFTETFKNHALTEKLAMLFTPVEPEQPVSRNMMAKIFRLGIEALETEIFL
jgi:hypothetical protein